MRGGRWRLDSHLVTVKTIPTAADYICQDQRECDGQNSCCYQTGVCSNSQASNCVVGDANDPRFPPAGGPDIVNQVTELGPERL